MLEDGEFGGLLIEDETIAPVKDQDIHMT